MIIGRPILTGEYRRAIKSYGRSPTPIIGKEVNFAHYSKSQVPCHPIPVKFTEKDVESTSYTMKMPRS